MKHLRSKDTIWSFSKSPWRVGSVALEDSLSTSLTVFESAGVRVPESGRHRQALKLLAKSNRAPEGIAGLTANERRRLPHVHRTGFEASLIAAATYRMRRSPRTTPFTTRKLQEMMGGGEAYGPGRSSARDVQFELFVAAQMVLGGLSVSHGEPDLRFLYGPERVGISVKRLDSLKAAQVRRNVQEAAGQIEKSRMRGWVALNLDNRFIGLPLFGNRPTILKRFTQAFDWISPIAAECAAGPHVLGIMAYAYLSDWRPVNSRRKVPELLVRVPFRWVVWESDNAAAKLFFEDFHDGWRGRIDDAVYAIMSGRTAEVV